MQKKSVKLFLLVLLVGIFWINFTLAQIVSCNSLVKTYTGTDFGVQVLSPTYNITSITFKADAVWNNGIKISFYDSIGSLLYASTFGISNIQSTRIFGLSDLRNVYRIKLEFNSLGQDSRAITKFQFEGVPNPMVSIPPIPPTLCSDNPNAPCGDYPDCRAAAYLDSDGDGYGTGNTLVCIGGVLKQGDCNDSNANVNFDAKEVCGNNIDDDCDSSIDEGCSTSSLNPNLKWENLNNDVISTAQVNDEVVLFFGNNNIGTSINYSIRNETNQIVSGSTSSGYVVWKARTGNYSFNITGNNGATWNLSSNIIVSSIESNALPTLVISSPLERSVYTNGTIIDFNQTTKDEDDLLNLTWDFGGIEIPSVLSSYSYFEKLLGISIGNTKKSYSKSGIYNIKLFAKEKSRNLGAFNYTSVIILQEGINVVPIITTPIRGKTYSQVVYFNASETFVADCKKCPTGGCATSGVWANKKGFYSDDKLLNCSYVHAPLSPKTGLSGYKLFFNWTLVDEKKSISGYWNETNYYGAVEFIYPYAEAKEHITKLSVTYNEI